jgi:hypothetical protein
MYIGRWLESIPKLEELLKSTPFDPKAVRPHCTILPICRLLLLLPVPRTAPAGPVGLACHGPSIRIAELVGDRRHSGRAVDSVRHPRDGQLGIPEVRARCAAAVAGAGLYSGWSAAAAHCCWKMARSAGGALGSARQGKQSAFGSGS